MAGGTPRSSGETPQILRDSGQLAVADPGAGERGHLGAAIAHDREHAGVVVGEAGRAQVLLPPRRCCRGRRRNSLRRPAFLFLPECVQ